MSESKRVWSIPGNSQRLDGGAMFGNAPRALWQRWVTSDEDNLIPLATRTMLIREASGRVLLFDTGIGSFFPPNMRARYGVQEAEHVLLRGLAAAGVSPADVDVVVLSHLHFDHAGGLLDVWADGKRHSLCFPRARILVSRGAWERARKPHPRDRASFILELPALLADSGRLEIVEVDRSELLGSDYRFHFSDGHTPGLMLTEVAGEHGPLLFASDLIPGCAWMHAPMTMGYDRNPELLVDEKAALLSDLHGRGGRVLFVHDSEVAAASVHRDDRQRFCPGQTWEKLRGELL
jgi:glyoxylase-like metal-dependent hydrolase (beta-lactamase superfamily II)